MKCHSVKVILTLLLPIALAAKDSQPNLEITSLFGLSKNENTVMEDQEGILRKSSILWKDIINRCEGNLILNSAFHPLIKSRCCSLSTKDLNIHHEPLATLSGVQALTGLNEIKAIGNQSENSMYAFALVQFQKNKSQDFSHMRVCFPVIYENNLKIDSNDYTTLLAQIKQYVHQHPTWSIDYYYFEPTIKTLPTTCDLINQNGDVNKDGAITPLDNVVLTKEYIKKSISDQRFDFNQDKKLNDDDVVALRDYILKKLPCQKNKL